MESHWLRCTLLGGTERQKSCCNYSGPGWYQDPHGSGQFQHSVPGNAGAIFCCVQHAEERPSIAPISHGHPWDGVQDVTGWLWDVIHLTEITSGGCQMDWVRLVGMGKQLISRHGNIIYCPSLVPEQLPHGLTLDGELWMETGTTWT